MPNNIYLDICDSCDNFILEIDRNGGYYFLVNLPNIKYSKNMFIISGLKLNDKNCCCKKSEFFKDCLDTFIECTIINEENINNRELWIKIYINNVIFDTFFCDYNAYLEDEIHQYSKLNTQKK